MGKGRKVELMQFATVLCDACATPREELVPTRTTPHRSIILLFCGMSPMCVWSSAISVPRGLAAGGHVVIVGMPLFGLKVWIHEVGCVEV